MNIKQVLSRFISSNDIPGHSRSAFASIQRTFDQGRVSAFQSWHQKYGDVYRVWLGPYENYVFHHPDDLHEILVSKNQEFRKDAITRDLQVLLGNGLLTAERDVWSKNRKIISKFFTPKQIRKYAAGINDVSNRVCDMWQDGGQIDLQREMMAISVQVVLETLFGIEDRQMMEMMVVLNRMLDDFHELYHTAWRLVPPIVPHPLRKRFVNDLGALDAIFSKLIDKKRQSESDGDLLATLIASVDEEGDGLSEKQLRDEAMTLFMAGHETVALSLSYTLFLLSKHPEVLKKVEDEVDQYWKNGESRDLDQLSYTRLVLKESMRMYPPAWVIGRETLEDVTIGDTLIPKGVQVLMPQCVIHRDERWYPEPDRFYPDRWSPALSKDLPRFAYFPFGGGERICIGERFAIMEQLIILAVVIRNHRVVPVKDTVETKPATTLRLAHPMMAKVERRRRN